MECLEYTDTQLKETILRLEKLASIVPKQQVLIENCQSFGWSIQIADSLVIEFETHCRTLFFVDLHSNDSVSGGFIALCFLDWDEFEGTNLESEKSKGLFDKKYFETVSIVKDLLGEPYLTIKEINPHQQCSVWRKETAFIFVIQGADDIEGIDIRLWLEYFDGNDEIPNSQIFEWLCQRHLSKIE
jgi:hypothetical protein